jgi:hypothetical protein
MTQASGASRRSSLVKREAGAGWKVSAPIFVCEIRDAVHEIRTTKKERLLGIFYRSTAEIAWLEHTRLDLFARPLKNNHAGARAEGIAVWLRMWHEGCEGTVS